jgi:hypothetical protein
MSDPREEIQIAAMFASGVGAELRDIDQKWESRSTKNMATKMDVRSIIKGVCTPNGEMPPPYMPPQAPPSQPGGYANVPIPVLPQARGDAPLPIPIEMGEDIMMGRVPQYPPPNSRPNVATAGGYQPAPVIIQPPIDDKQMMFELNLNAKDPKRIQTVNELTNHLEERLDKIEDHIKMILSFMVEIRRNTTRKYKKYTNETESTTRSDTEESD